MRGCKSAFTLMEMLVSVFLITLIVLFLYGAIGSMKLSNETLNRHSLSEQNRTLVFQLLYRDLLESSALETAETDSRHYTLLKFQTSNSLYRIAHPYVLYYVNSRTNTLIRLEAAREISLPVPYEDQPFIFADKILDSVTDFNVYTRNAAAESNATKRAPSDANGTKTSAPMSSSMVYLNTERLNKPILFEISTGR